MTELRQRLTLQELNEGVIPQNHVLVEMIYSCEGITSKGGVIIGVNIDDEYADETTGHRADYTEVYAKVYKTPERLYFKRGDPLSMSWDCDMVLQKGDIAFFNVIESRNSVEIECDDRVFKILPYQDFYCAKRETSLGTEVVMLNGYVLCEPIFTKTEHELAVDDTKEDKTRGKIAYVGEPNRAYQHKEYMDFVDLRVGDEVIFTPNSPIFKLERVSAIAQFNEGKLYNVVQRRRIAMVVKRGGEK